MRPLRILPLLTAALLSSALVAPASQALTTSGTSATTVAPRANSCMTDEYRTRVKNVRGTQSIGITRLEGITYPGRTRITQGQRVELHRNSNLKVAVSFSSSATLGASAMLKKVINLYGEISGRTAFKSSFSSTTKEAYYVFAKTTMTIPGGKSVAWFRGWRHVGGKFDYSFCHHYSGMPTYVGVVEWRTGSFRSYGYPASGGQRCDLTAQEAVARKAKKLVCV
ncbi:hypothetical protein [Nocardioides marmoribigeumensis]|uniref:Secreted protein n=1 Tax=Nocardioides marmoribigeumensis TaxID=433649 RepID=A0ABU2BZ20_9ACTN|nr:hypothetical protein [Nocardioides marmoribigeumensis]MDR7363624.1 hypothetical protein [Nocardioides marmoribigeumensis]